MQAGHALAHGLDKAPPTTRTHIKGVFMANPELARGAQLAAQHRFVTTAAHQLRTPLAVLNLQATYALRRIGAAEIARLSGLTVAEAAKLL